MNLISFSLSVPDIVVTPPSPPKQNTLTDLEFKDLETKDLKDRQTFFMQLMKSKKPLLQQSNLEPTPMDIAKEEKSITNYIAAEINSMDEH